MISEKVYAISIYCYCCVSMVVYVVAHPWAAVFLKKATEESNEAKEKEEECRDPKQTQK